MKARNVLLGVLVFLSAGSAFSQTFNLNPSTNPSIFSQPVAISTDVLTNIVSSRFPVLAGTTVNFMDGGQTGTSIGSAAVDNSGVATLTISTLAVGTHSIVACFDHGGQVCSNPLTQTVTQAQTALVLAASTNPSMPGQAVLLTATLSPRAPSTLPPTSGSITFLDGSTQLGTSTVTGSGTATLTRSFTAGSHSLMATFSGNSSFSSSSAQPLTQVVTTPTGIVLSSSPNPSIVGQPFVVTATISPSNVTGNITFSPGNGTIVSSQIVNGVATAAVTLNVNGAFQMTAQFAGNGTFAASTSNVVTQTVNAANQISPTLTLSASNNPTAAGQLVILIAGITPPNVNGSIAFLDGTTQIGSGTVVNGLASASASFATVGSHTLTAQFAGNGSVGAGTSPPLGEVVIGTAPSAYNSGNNTPTPIFLVQGQSFTPSVAGDRGRGSPPASGGVTLLGWSFDFQSPQSAPPVLYIYATPPTIAQVNNNGQGSLAMAMNGGGGIYLFNNLVLDVNTKYFAVLSAPASIFDDFGGYSGGFDLFGQPQASPTTISEGTFDTGFTAVFQPSTSPAATTTSLVVSPATSMAGQPATLTATVLPSAATGTVNFMDGATLLGSANLNGGPATFTLSSLGAGNHTLTAAYAGTVRFAASMSAPFTESIVAGPLTGAWTISQSHIGNFSSGQPVAFFTVTVMNTQGSGPSSGAVTVTEAPAANLNGAIILSGANWNCSGLTCTRSDSLLVGGSYPPITVAVPVPADGSTSLANLVRATGGGLTPASTTDTATIIPAFTDVPSNDSFLPAIDLLAESGITKGCGPGLYCEGASTTQAEMAVFIVRSVIGSDNFTFTQTPFFTDVPSSNLFFPWIQKMQDLGIAQTCGTNLFCPDSAVTRGQMAVLIILARYGTAIPPNIPTTPFFTDVPLTDPTFPFVQKMAQVGITVGCSATTYCPTTPVTRGQMAVFIMRGMFNLVPTPGVIPPLLSLSQANLVQGTTATLTIQAQFSHFASGMTQVSSGPGITVSSVNVVNATTLTVQVSAALTATPGPRSIVVTTGSEEGTLPNMLIVSPHP